MQQGGAVITKELVLKLIEWLAAIKLVKDEVDNEYRCVNINLSCKEIGTILGALQAWVDNCKK